MAVRRWWCWAAVDVGGRSSPFPDGGGGFGGGHCKKRAVVTCDIAFVTSPDWDVSNCLNRSECVVTSSILRHCVAILLSGSVPLLVYPHKSYMYSPFDPVTSQGGTGIKKKDPGSISFFPWTLRGLTNYVIRHQSKYSNMTSSSEALPPSSLRRLTTGCANP